MPRFRRAPSFEARVGGLRAADEPRSLDKEKKRWRASMEYADERQPCSSTHRRARARALAAYGGATRGSEESKVTTPPTLGLTSQPRRPAPAQTRRQSQHAQLLRSSGAGDGAAAYGGATLDAAAVTARAAEWRCARQPVTRIYVRLYGTRAGARRASRGDEAAATRACTWSSGTQSCGAACAVPAPRIRRQLPACSRRRGRRVGRTAGPSASSRRTSTAARAPPGRVVDDDVDATGILRSG